MKRGTSFEVSLLHVLLSLLSSFPVYKDHRKCADCCRRCANEEDPPCCVVFFLFGCGNDTGVCRLYFPFWYCTVIS